ncbi:MAG: hypothetical protein KC800_32850 [Candidatus Eremiobacteraeota bacterium]|nr:hypothetical protein [Candidatus Eremiobacteraeota bacterium]
MSDDSNQLSDYLSKQSAEGTRLDDDQNFTISPEKAWEKVSVHALPFPEAWALELVKAANLAGCSELTVTQTTEVTEFCLRKSTGWNRDWLVEVLVSFDGKVPREYFHVATVARVLAKVLGNPYKLGLGIDPLIIWDGERLDVVDATVPGGETQETLRLSISNKAGNQSSFFGKLFKFEERGFMADIAKILHSRAFCSSVPVSIDSRPIRGLHTHPDFAVSKLSKPLFYFQAPSSEALPAFRIGELAPWEHLKRDAPIGLNPTPGNGLAHIPPDGDLGDVGAVALLSVFFSTRSRPSSFLNSKNKVSALGPGNRHSRLLWLQDGVVVDQEFLWEGAFAVLIAASAEGLKTDISGYQLVKDELYLSRKNKVVETISGEILSFLSANSLSNNQIVAVDTIEVVMNSIFGVIGLIFVIPGVLFLADLAYGNSAARKLSTECEVAFRDEFAVFLEDLKSQ